MKEKISCSLDGDLIEWMDELLTDFPVLGSRSAVIEMSLLYLFDIAEDFTCKGVDRDNRFIHHVYEKRCLFNAKKESTN